MTEPKKLTGGKAFDALAAALVRVPKTELAAAEKRYQKRKKPKKKK